MSWDITQHQIGAKINNYWAINAQVTLLLKMDEMDDDLCEGKKSLKSINQTNRNVANVIWETSEICCHMQTARNHCWKWPGFKLPSQNGKVYAPYFSEWSSQIRIKTSNWGERTAKSRVNDEEFEFKNQTRRQRKRLALKSELFRQSCALLSRN